MHIAFLSSDYVGAQAFDRDTALIGALHALGQTVTVIVPISSYDPMLQRIRSRCLRILGYNVATHYDKPLLRQYARFIENALAGTKPDVIFSRSPRFTAWLKTPLPVVNWFDAAFVCLENFYAEFTHLDSFSRFSGHRAASLALRRSNLTLLKSSWAVEKANRRYHIPESRLGVLQAAASLPEAPSRPQILSRRSSVGKAIRCLVVGNDWHRKGCDIALEAVRKARGMGLGVHLTALGIKTPAGISPEPWLRLLAPLKKGLPDEFDKFCQEFLSADVLLVPSRADFTPNVICEACAFGLPAIGSLVGAIPEMIEHGQTGFVARNVDDADEYAQFLRRLATEPGLLFRMSVESRNKYEAEFALPVVARKLVAHLESVLYRADTIAK